MLGAIGGFAAGVPKEAGEGREGEEGEEEGDGVLCWSGMARTSKTVYLYCFPVLLILGLLLNSVNCVMFRSFVGLRHSSFAVFMTAAGVVDSLALVSQAPRRWLRFVYEALGAGPTSNDADDAVCRAFAFAAEATQFASLWVVVLIAAERSIAALLPHRRPRRGRRGWRRRADLCALVAVVASGLVLSSHVFMTWQTSLPESSSNATTAMTSATQERTTNDVIATKSESKKSTNNGQIFFRKDPTSEQEKEEKEREKEKEETARRLRGVLKDRDLERKFEGIPMNQRISGGWKGQMKVIEGIGRSQELKVADGASRQFTSRSKKNEEKMTKMISSAAESHFSLIGDTPTSVTSQSSSVLRSDVAIGNDIVTSRDGSATDANGTSVNGRNVTGHVKSNETESHFFSASHFADNVTLAQREGIYMWTANDNSERNEAIHEFSQISNGNEGNNYDHDSTEENRWISRRQKISLAPRNGKREMPSVYLYQSMANQSEEKDYSNGTVFKLIQPQAGDQKEETTGRREPASSPGLLSPCPPRRRRRRQCQFVGRSRAAMAGQMASLTIEALTRVVPCVLLSGLVFTTLAGLRSTSSDFVQTRLSDDLSCRLTTERYVTAMAACVVTSQVFLSLPQSVVWLLDVYERYVPGVQRQCDERQTAAAATADVIAELILMVNFAVKVLLCFISGRKILRL